jgi:phospholipid/cholesterol/gamma-HCH transport system substrate-binding protein
MRIGICLVVALAAVLVAGCGAFGGSGDGLVIEVEFERTFNLFEGSQVRVVGVDAGRVESVTVEPGSDIVRVRLRLHDGIQVPEDVSAVIVQGALLGERYVQLHPPYEGGRELTNGATIPLERTTVPTEFEEAFESLNDMLEALDPDEVARVVTNLADIVDGQGETLGETLESVRDMVAALRDSDEELVRMVRTLADLNETVATRAQAMGRQFENLNTLAATLASERADLDRSLQALAHMTEVLADLVATHRDNLEDDLAAVTRVGRTASRNLDHFGLFLEGQAELFRHAERAAFPERNWIVVRNHDEAIHMVIADRVAQRLVGLCLRLGLEECDEVEFWEAQLADGLCLPPIVECPEDMTTVGEALERALETIPDLGDGQPRDDDDEDGLDLPDPIGDDPLDPAPDARRAWGGIQ